MRQETTFGKVIVRSRDGTLFRGFSKSDLIGDKVQLVDAKGNAQEFPLADLKAVFFVRDFEGNRDYREVRFFRKEGSAGWLWVEVVFTDGEIMEGRMRNNLSLLDPRGVYLWLSDEGANNEVVFVVRSAVREFRILGTI